MLDKYRVNYEELLEGREPLVFLRELNQVRNDLIHRGNTSVEKISYYQFKLNSLVVRIILSIIDYDGWYWEDEKLEFSNPPEYYMYAPKKNGEHPNFAR